MISFHYRPVIDKSELEFKRSGYLKGVNEFLNSESLKKLVHSGNRVVFITHARLKKYAKCFKIPDYIWFANNKPYQDMFI